MDEINQNSQSQKEAYPVELNSMMMTMPFFDEMLVAGESVEQIKLYIKYPMRYNYQIRRLSRIMYGLNGQFSNVVDYMVSAPSLDMITVCYDQFNKNIKKQQQFKKLLKKINHKLTTRDIIMSLLIDGLYVGLLRDTQPKNKDVTIQPGVVESLDILDSLAIDNSLMIQPLDVDYIKVIGFNNDYIVAFDMQYFDSFIGNGLVGEIKNYPVEFAKAYLDYKKDGNKRWFRLDQSKTIVLKFKSNKSEPWGRPLSISAMNDMLFSDQYTDSQRKNIRELASVIRWLKQPEGEVKGKSSLNNDQQKNQYDNFKNAVFANARDDGEMNKTTTLVLAPGTEVGKLEVGNDLLKDTLTSENTTKTATDLGFAAAALNGTGEGGASYSSLQVNIDLVLTQIWQILEQVQWQYNKVLNSLIKNSEDTIEMIYLKTSQLTKEKDVTNAKELYTLGGGSRLYWMACTGADIDAYMSLMDYEREMKFDEKYPPHQTAYTNNGDMGGKPTSNSDNPLTVQTKTNNSNNYPKPSD